MSEHDEFYLLSEELEEYPWNMMDKIYDNEKISIWVSPCGIQKWYFKVFNHDMEKFCRISMTEPKILNYSDEALTLSNNDIDEIIYALTNNVIEDETGWFWLINEDETGWFWLINEYNMVGTDFPIPEDLPMPDYNLLKSVPAQRINLIF